MAQIPSDKIQPRAGHIFPDMESIPYQDKQKPDYNIQICKAIYSQYTGNKTDVAYSDVDDYVDSLRLIAQGKQSAEQYKDFFTGGDIPSPTVLNDSDTALKSNAEASRKGWFTGYWKALSVIPNMKTRVKGEFLKNDSDIKTFCTDVDASVDELYRMNKEWVKNSPKYKPVFNMLRQTIGLPTDNEITTDSYEALLDIKNEGGFKENYMLAVDEAISHTEDVSNWKTSLKEQHFDDLFDLGCAFNVLDYDVSDCKVIWKYVDPKNVINQFTTQKDGSDSQYFGWFEYPSLNYIREIQDRVWNGNGYGINKEQFGQIAKQYEGYLSNVNSRYFTNKSSSRDEIDITTCVMRLRWIDVEKRRESEYTNKGVTSRVPYKEGHEKNKAYKIIETRELKEYNCSWLVGTEFCWDFGVAKNQAFVNGKPTLRYAMYKLKEESYIERLVPIAHLFAISWLNFINFAAKAQKDFTMINVDRLSGYGDGDKKFEPALALKMLRQELVLFHKDPPINQGGTNDPIKFVKGVALEQMMSELAIMERLLKVAEYITGLSPMTMGATPEDTIPVRTALASINSSNVALSYLMNGVMIMKSKLAEQTIPMLSNLFEVEEKSVKYYSKVIGREDVESIKKHRESLSSLGIKLYPRPTDEMKDNLAAQIDMITQQQLLDPVTALRIKYQLFHGSQFMAILHKVDFKVRQEKDRQFKEKQALLKEQADGNDRAARTQIEGQQMLQNNEIQMNDALETKKAQMQSVNDNNNFANEAIKMILMEKEKKGENIEEMLAKIKSMADIQTQRMMQGVM